MEIVKGVKIGDKFIKKSIGKRVCEVIDFHRTYNNKNELVKIECVAQYDFLEQKITFNCPCSTVFLNKITA